MLPLATASDRKPLPNELIYKILTFTIAENVHSICTKEPVVRWALDIIPILSTVSFTFWQITTEIVTKAFSTNPPNESPLMHVRQQLVALHDMGIYVRPAGFDMHLAANRKHLQEGSALIQAYSLYMNSVHLRRSVAHTRDAVVFVTAMEPLQDALTVALELCSRAQPRGIDAFVRRAVVCEAVFVRSGIGIVRVCAGLAGALDMRMATDKAIHVGLLEIEKAMVECSAFVDERVDDVCLENCLSHGNHRCRDRLVDFPGASDVLSRCKQFGRALEVDEYEILRRADKLYWECETLLIAWGLHA